MIDRLQHFILFFSLGLLEVIILEAIFPLLSGVSLRLDSHVYLDSRQSKNAPRLFQFISLGIFIAIYPRHLQYFFSVPRKCLQKNNQTLTYTTLEPLPIRVFKQAKAH